MSKGIIFPGINRNKPIYIKENMKEIKTVLRQDDDGHWYLIPQSEVADFDMDLGRLEGKEYIDCPDEFDRFIEDWSELMTGGSPDLIPEYYEQNRLKPIR